MAELAHPTTPPRPPLRLSMPVFRSLSTSFATAILLTISSLAHGNEGEGEKLFALKIKSLISEKCIACHGSDPEDLGGGFDLRSREAMIHGGDSFGDEVVISGDGEASYLYLLTTRSEAGMEMPPKESEQLTEEETWWIRDWINSGAPWPNDKQVAEIQEIYAQGEQVPTSGGLSEDWSQRRYESRNLWAYRPLDVSTVPENAHPIDWFVDRRLEQLGLQAAPDADPRQLARRLSFGLTGLPPTPEEANRFQQEMNEDADVTVSRFAERLMQSPHYGEHFARQWLDVARYADSAGFANDYARPNAWRYRDYVIRAFNDDKPYTQFVREQIAGDEIDPEDSEKLIATGFLRMGPWEQTSMSVFRVTRQQWIDDVTDSVGQTFLAHALQCARCHDHKFDPVPTRDFYSMAAVFSTTQFAERDAVFLDDESQRGFKPADRWTSAKIQAYKDQQNELNSRVSENRKQESGDAKVGDNGLSPGDEASLARMRKNISRHTWELDKTRPIAFCVYTGKTIERKNVGNRVNMPDKPWGKGVLEPDTILNGGDPFSRGEAVDPAPLSAAVLLGNMQVALADEAQTITFASGQAKRRLALADWIVDRSNPLTARVIVNRIWSWHFGQGLAANPNNFGATGSPPTHPKLLDTLADWFMKNGWSVKKLNRLITTSKAYRRSANHPDPSKLAEVDPKLDAYAVFRPRRLTAEEIRDTMLACSGELNREVGGIPCRPDINLEVAFQPRQIMGGTASVYEPDRTPSQRNRRTIYAEKVRGLRDPFLETFNQPGPDKSCELRETSTVAPQALTMLNATESQDRALAMAARLMQDERDDDARIHRLFEIAVGRPASEHELAACLQQWKLARDEEKTKTYEEVHYASEIERTVMAEKTGEPYDFVEILPAYDSYVPDAQPSQFDASTRGLAHICLVVFNLNEFAYID